MIPLVKQRSGDMKKTLKENMDKIEKLERRISALEDMIETFSEELKKRSKISGKENLLNELKTAIDDNKRALAEIRGEMYSMSKRLDELDSELSSLSYNSKLIDELNKVIDDVSALANSMQIVNKLVERQERMIELMKKAVRGIISREEFEKEASSFGKLQFNPPKLSAKHLKPLATKEKEKQKPSKSIPPAKFISQPSEMPLVEEVVVGESAGKKAKESTSKSTSKKEATDPFYKKVESISSDLSEKNVDIVKSELLGLVTDKLADLKKKIANLPQAKKQALLLKATQAELGVVSLSSALNSKNISLAKRLISRLVTLTREIEKDLE